MNITDYLMSKTKSLKKLPEYCANPAGFSMFNTGGTEVEVGEFLYSFVKMIKPSVILETGTHFGISSMYMGQACLENKKGLVTTLEPSTTIADVAKSLWVDIEVQDYINSVIEKSLDYTGTHKIDFLFLDSEPNIRFDEFNKYWPMVRSGGFIAIHDLHPSLSYAEIPINGMECWPYGDFRPKIGKYILDHDVQVISFPTPRGFTLFQKKSAGMAYTRHLLGEI